MPYSREDIDGVAAIAYSMAAQIKRLQAELTPAQRVAEALHETCRQNHSYTCGWWTIESWRKPGTFRNHYLKKAQEMLDTVGGNEDIVMLAISGGLS